MGALRGVFCFFWLLRSSNDEIISGKEINERNLKEYDKQRGTDFLRGRWKDYFVHAYGLGPKLKSLGINPGQKVAFDLILI
ncbi:MAG: hypothetical protein Ct9H90mP7_4590 [Candidatus Neomarinimicrobiota bacterium]|nr:MAG: hypothetical protein Ct9H90mP7_4590 [Candidatus Neomarinimicrobiota bacterium]